MAHSKSQHLAGRGGKTTSSKPAWDIHLRLANQPEVFCEGGGKSSMTEHFSSIGGPGV